MREIAIPASLILISLGYLMRGKNPKMPWYFCVIGGLFGYVISLACWEFFGALPYQTRQSLGIVGGEDWAFGEILVPVIAGFLFLLSIGASVLALRQPMRYRKIAVIGSNIVPGMLLFWPAIGTIPLWYLGFAMFMLLTGFCWGFVFYEVAVRRAKFAFAQS